MPGLDDQHALGRKQPRCLRNERAIGVQSVHSAVKCCKRIMIADLGGEAGDVGRADVGRIGHDQIERARQCCGVIAGNEADAVGQPQIESVVVSCL